MRQPIRGRRADGCRETAAARRGAAEHAGCGTHGVGGRRRDEGGGGEQDCMHNERNAEAIRKGVRVVAAETVAASIGSIAATTIAHTAAPMTSSARARTPTRCRRSACSSAVGATAGGVRQSFDHASRRARRVAARRRRRGARAPR